MKTLVKFIMIVILLLGLYNLSYGQTTDDTLRLVLGKVEPYHLEVTFNKTTHLIFPAGIRYVDLGSDVLIAGKAEDAENVLRVKAAVRDFPEETNFSVITTDGKFFSFNVRYHNNPSTLSYDLVQMQKTADRKNNSDVLFEELGNNTPSLTQLLMESIYKRNKRIIRHIRTQNYGVRFLLKGIYIHNELFYFHTELKNKSNIPFNIDFVTFKIVDKKLAKRTVIQEKRITPLRLYKPLVTIANNAVDQNVFLFNQFTLTDGKELKIEIFEKNGGRQQVLRVDNEDLVRAGLIRDMHLKIN